MKKSTAIVGVIVVLGVAYVGTSWYLGKRAEETVVRVVDDANGRLVRALGPHAQGMGVKIEIADYQRGWFSSDVSYVIHTKDDQGEPFTIALSDHMGHGPFPINALKDGKLQPMLAYSQAQLAPTPSTQKWFDAMKSVPPVNAVTRIGFDSSGDTTWNFLPLDYADDDLRAVFSGGSVKVEFANDFKDSVASGQFDSFTLTSKEDKEDAVMSNMRIAGTSESIGEGPDDTKVTSRLTVETISLNEESGRTVLANNFGVSFDSERRGQMMDLDVRYDLGGLTIKDQPLGEFSFGFGGRQVHADALTRLASYYEELPGDEDGSEANQGSSADREARIMESLTELLASEPKLSLSPIQWKNSAGDSLAAVELDLSKPTQDPAAVGLQAYAAQAVKRVKLDVSLSKPMAMKAFEQASTLSDDELGLDAATAEELYDAYVQKLQGLELAVVDGDIAKSTIVYESNGFNVNGQEVSLPEFMMRVMMLGQ
ncbi:MAG: YdgA family protein [Candidimonas sp.]